MFTGRRFNSDTGDYYYRARYYNSSFGRFGAVDRYVPDEMTFGYVGGNPVMGRDVVMIKRSLKKVSTFICVLSL